MAVDQTLILQPLDRGKALWDEGRYEDALPHFAEAAATNPDDADVVHFHAFALQRLGRLDQAIDEYRRAARLAPDNAGIRLGLAEAYRATGQSAEALDLCREAARLSPHWAEARLNLGDVLAEDGQLEDAEAELRKAIRLDAERPETWVSLGAVLRRAGRPGGAESAVREAIRLRRDYGQAYSEWSCQLYLAGRRNEAEITAREAHRLLPTQPYPPYLLSLIACERGEAETAKCWFDRYLELDSGDLWGLRLVLAEGGILPTPERPPQSYLQHIYKERATYWDRTVDHEKPYRGPELVDELLRRFAGDEGGLAICDAGCGTGLVGILVKPLASRLDGVDLSPPMLAKAAEKDIYDTLAEEDLVSFLERSQGRYDAITCAATLIHIRDLEPVFRAALSALRPNGLFVFTVFGSDNDAVTVTPGANYYHPRSYIAETAARVGLAVETIEERVHEY